MATVKLGRRALASIGEIIKPTVLYDSELKGFGLRLMPPSKRNPTGARTWVVEYRPGAGGRGVAKKRVSLGSTEAVSPEKARNAARAMLASVRLGADPNAERAEERAAKTLRELRTLYCADADPVRKPRTVSTYRIYWDNHVLPAIGHLTARRLTKQDITRLHRITIGAGHKVTANRVITMLAHFFKWASDAGYVPKGHNPCDNIDRFPESSKERFLSHEELGRLGAALDKAETIGVRWRREAAGPLSKHAPKDEKHRSTVIEADAADAIRMLIFTGARLSEILSLKWEYFDRQRAILFLPDSKTGKKSLQLAKHAAEILDRLWRRSTHPDGIKPLNEPPSKFVFPTGDLKSYKRDLKRPWMLVTREAKLGGLRIHDLRHSFASIGAAADIGLPVIGKLLGHASPQTTARYAHLANTPLRAANNLISSAIFDAMSFPIPTEDSATGNEAAASS